MTDAKLLCSSGIFLQDILQIHTPETKMIGKLLKHRFTYQFVNNSKRIMNDNTQSKLFEKEYLLGFNFLDLKHSFLG